MLLTFACLQFIEKTLPGSFANTDLQEYLQSIGAKKVVLVGYMVSLCPYMLPPVCPKANC